MDSKNIKDYLHLYLGCECRCYSTWDADGWKDTVTPDLLISVDDEDSEIGGLHLILRPLSDMTEEEVKELFKYEAIKLSYSNISFERHLVLNNILRGITVNYDTVTPDGTFSSSWTLNFSATNAHDFKWLLLKGFDLFGLIESGLAIKKSS